MRIAPQEEYWDFRCPSCDARLQVESEDRDEREPLDEFEVQCRNCDYEFMIYFDVSFIFDYYISDQQNPAENP